jgi:uncharacterized protein (DUF488 family)
MSLYSIGHSNARMESFLDLLRRHRIVTLVDVRSMPYSRYNPHFGREALQRAVEEAGIAYRFLGDRIGGKPARKELLREDGRADYEKIAASAPYQEGIAQLIALGASAETAFMCAEADYRDCHRHWLITRTLLDRGVPVSHILHTGDPVAADPDDFHPRQARLF